MLLRIIVGLVKEQNKSKKERKRTRGETQQMMKTANIESEREREKRKQQETKITQQQVSEMERFELACYDSDIHRASLLRIVY